MFLKLKVVPGGIGPLLIRIGSARNVTRTIARRLRATATIMEELLRKIANAKPRNEAEIVRCWWDAQHQARLLLDFPLKEVKLKDDF